MHNSESLTSSIRRRAASVVVALALVLAACDGRQRAIDGLRGVKLSPVRPKPEFTLDDTHGQPFHFAADTRGMATLLYFGYTNCPDVCPTHMSNIAAALKKMPADEQARVRVVFVTTDPARDTAQALRAWLDNFDKRFIGLRGSLDSVNAIQAQLGLPPAAMEAMDAHGAGPRNYGMGHAAQVLAFSADDSLRAEYPNGFSSADWANDLPKLLKIAR
ncbi:MAG TPA: SCO family protein [Gemmatimonadaceae bacterium]|nr:SCO family protein [Gemmatimonadaceae bacterium]